jgi:hypothetical protein
MAASIALIAGCASTGEVQEELAQQMMLGDYPSALLVVESQKTGAFDGKNQLLYFLERGMLLHYDGQFAESNAAFEQAKRIGDALYTESLSDQGFSLMSNDYALDYAGENFERTMIHLFSALNYIQLGEKDSALVEIRQVIRTLPVGAALRIGWRTRRGLRRLQEGRFSLSCLRLGIRCRGA